jgi:hypothetical protein
MRWDDTEASQCRWSEYAEEIWADAEILWEDSEADYQGHANVFARHPDGRYSWGGWSYGSCSGCDGWEGLADEEIRKAFREDVVFFENKNELRVWFTMLELTNKGHLEDEGKLDAIAKELDTCGT